MQLRDVLTGPAPEAYLSRKAAAVQVRKYLREGEELQMTKELAMSDAGKGLLLVIGKAILGKQRGLESLRTSSVMADLIAEARSARLRCVDEPAACAL